MPRISTAWTWLILSTVALFAVLALLSWLFPDLVQEVSAEREKIARPER